MIFADNILRLQHTAGFGMEFTALEALKLVDAKHDHLKVAVAQAWKEARFVCCYFTFFKLLAPGRCASNFQCVISKHLFSDILSISSVLQNCPPGNAVQAPNHYLNQY